MSYANYSVEDFLTNDRFKAYCSGSDSNVSTFREEVIRDAPDIAPVFDEAVRWYRLLSAEQGNVGGQLMRLTRRITGETTATAAPRVRRIYRQIAAIAASILLISALIYFLYPGKSSPSLVEKDQKNSPAWDIAPGSDKATLTLSDGRVIELDSVSDGDLAREGTVSLSNVQGQLHYTPATGSASGPLYNIVSTPRGGQYKILLEDGTKVWLNAGSSLRFPAAFFGPERKVELTGEGYFEVAPNKAKPFYVLLTSKSGSEPVEQVRVLGTHFNINAYADESGTTTTVLEGSVEYSKGKSSVVLKQNQQATETDGAISVSANANTEAAVAWKNGKFDFGEAMDVNVIMRQLSRWYNIEVQYPEPVHSRIGGSISRQVPISGVLDMLQMTGAIRFSVEGSVVKVMKNK